MTQCAVARLSSHAMPQPLTDWQSILHIPHIGHDSLRQDMHGQRSRAQKSDWAEGHLHSSANFVASLSLTFLMTRSSMMSQKLYVQDITLRTVHGPSMASWLL